MTFNYNGCPEPIKLTGVRADGQEVHVNACGTCGFTAPDERMARECCATRLCDCGTEIEKYWTACSVCRERTRGRKEQKLFDKAEKLRWQDADFPWVIDTHFFFDGDYLGEYLFELKEEGHALPQYAWTTYKLTLSADASDIVENMLSEHHEDARDEMSDEAIEDLQAKLNKWCADQGVATYFEDNSIAVDLTGYLTACGDCRLFQTDACASSKYHEVEPNEQGCNKFDPNEVDN